MKLQLLGPSINVIWATFQQTARVVWDRFTMSNHSKTIKINYIKIISDNFNVINDHFKTKMYIGSV